MPERQGKNQKKRTQDDPADYVFLSRPRLRLGDTCRTEELILGWGVSKNTISKWRKQGLQPLADDTKSQVFLLDDVVAFLKAQRK